MPEQSGESAPEARGLLPPSSENRRHLYAVGALGSLAALSTVADLTGARDNLPGFVEFVETSGRHPMVGYIGAWAATSLIKNPVGKIKAWTAAAGAAIADIAAESGQVVSPWAIPEFADFWTSRNLPETSKDAIAAALGFGVFMLTNRRRK